MTFDKADVILMNIHEAKLAIIDWFVLAGIERQSAPPGTFYLTMRMRRRHPVLVKRWSRGFPTILIWIEGRRGGVVPLQYPFISNLDPHPMGASQRGSG